MRRIVNRTLALVLFACSLAHADSSSILSSWNEGAAKSRIVEFVGQVTDPRSRHYVPPAERIAVFDNDGTLWSEQPMYVQLAFVLDRVRALAPHHPDWKTTQPFKAVLEKDVAALAAQGEQGFRTLLAAVSEPVSSDEYARLVADWITTARHPEYRRPYTETVYQPMLELLTYLRANGFKTFIVSGGGIDFMRPWTERVYGIPPEQVVGTENKLAFQADDDRYVVMREAQIQHVNDGPGKPVGIVDHIGRRPIAAFGNSDGDLQMLQYTAAGDGLRLALIVHHTDGVRETAYDRTSHIGKLDKALDEAQAHGWVVVDMKQDWNRIFSFE